MSAPSPDNHTFIYRDNCTGTPSLPLTRPPCLSRYNIPLLLRLLFLLLLFVQHHLAGDTPSRELPPPRKILYRPISVPSRQHIRVSGKIAHLLQIDKYKFYICSVSTFEARSKRCTVKTEKQKTLLWPSSVSAHLSDLLASWRCPRKR